MARNTTPRGGPSRIRFVMVEADLQEGDLEQVTQVLRNAFRTTQFGSHRPQIQRLNSRAAPQHLDDGAAPDIEPVDDAEEVEEILPTRPRAPRKAKPARVPTVLNDIDAKSDTSLKDFVADYDIKTAFEKYLLIALWFRDCRSISEITVDHVYTCFKLLGWPTSSNDFSKPLRNLKDQQYLTGDTKGYSLTLTGAGKVESKKRSS